MANSMALLDAKLRGVGPDEARGGARLRQLFLAHRPAAGSSDGHRASRPSTSTSTQRRAQQDRWSIVWGMNWISTKMPDAHWLTEARLQGTKVVVIACRVLVDLHPRRTSAIVVRPGTDAGAGARVCPQRHPTREALRRRLRQRRWTDLPLLVRMDTKQHLRASEVFGPGYQAPLDQRHEDRGQGRSEDRPPFRRTQERPAVIPQSAARRVLG